MTKQHTGLHRKLRAMQVCTFYPAYLNQFYEQRPALLRAPYAVQRKRLFNDGFAAAHMFIPWLPASRFETQLVIANSGPLQSAWLQENQISYHGENWLHDIVALQIEAFEPDIVYFNDPVLFGTAFIQGLSWQPRLVMGWRAAVIPEQADWTGYDIIFSNIPLLLQKAYDFGAKQAIHLHPAIPHELFPVQDTLTKKEQVVFTGQYSDGLHAARDKLLETIACAAKGSHEHSPFCYACYLSCAPQVIPDALRPFAKPPVYGLAMHQALMQNAIAINTRASVPWRDPTSGMLIDLGRSHSVAMRLFEATAARTLLLTEQAPNLPTLFTPGEEIETFASQKELLDKIACYLAHPQKREAIALRGYRRCLKEHSMAVRIREFEQHIIAALDNTARNA